MKISRKGAAADHGVRSVILDKAKVSFDPDDGEFLSKFDDPVHDFSQTGSRHTYRITQTLPDYLAMTKQISSSIKEVSDDALLKELQKSIPHFLRLATILVTRP